MHLNIICPFCDGKHPVPFDFDDVYDCDCGASYWIGSSNLLENEMTIVSKSVLPGDLLRLTEEEEMGLCQVVVNKEFDQLISLIQSDETPEMRFSKYDRSSQLALVWMKRP
ncbi:MAG: hypothetical protein OES18_09370 [Deltaproteobacteria bacterium]|nr:hypothetical protein [Deltaproteobacteria bacterium]